MKRVLNLQGVNQEEPKRLSAWLSAILSRRICELAPVGTGLVVLLNRLIGLSNTDRLEKGFLEFATSLLQRLYMDLSMHILPRIIGIKLCLPTLSTNSKLNITEWTKGLPRVLELRLDRLLS